MWRSLFFTGLLNPSPFTFYRVLAQAPFFSVVYGFGPPFSSFFLAAA